MKKKYPDGKVKRRITITLDEKLNKIFDDYMIANGYFNKSKLVEDIIKKQIEEDQKK